MTKKINIGLFIDTFFPMTDGVIMVVDNYAKRLNKIANVIVFAPAISKDFDDSKLPYQVVRCKAINLPFLDYSLPLPSLDSNFKKKLNSCKLDIVHIHSPFTLGKIGIKYAKKHNIPCIGTMHSQYKLDFKRVVKFNFLASILTSRLINLYNKCDECWAVNKAVGRIFYEDYHYKTFPRIMNNATEMLPVSDKKKAISYINKKYNIKKNEKVFLFVGRINILKNILFIVDSLAIVKQKDPDLKFKMIYVGSGQDEEVLRKRIKEVNLNNEVILSGKVTDREELSYFYARADLFLFPSIYDASSIVQIEAASQGTPGIFLKGTATSATIEDNDTGFIVNNNVEDYADKIIEVMKEEDLYNKVSTNTYKKLYKSWDDEIKEVYNLYLNFIKNK